MQSRLVWVTGGCAIIAAVLGAAVTGGFGLLGNGAASSARQDIAAGGGRGSNTNVCIGGGAYVQGSVNCNVTSTTRNGGDSGHSKIGAEFTQVPTGLFDIAFSTNIGIPSAIRQPAEQWEQLHRRGGIDARRSQFHVTLTNPSDAPITVTNIEAEITKVAPPLTAWVGSVFSQGVELLGHFSVLLELQSVGDHVPLRVPEGGMSFAQSSNPSFFASHDISLHPGELYHAIVAVTTSSAYLYTYRFLISAETASRKFVVRTREFRITGESGSRPPAHSVLYLGRCWVAEQPKTLPTCSP